VNQTEYVPVSDLIFSPNAEKLDCNPMKALQLLLATSFAVGKAP
jgi:hypothetical protein